MVNYISVASFTDTPVASFYDSDKPNISVLASISVKQLEVPDNIYIEKTYGPTMMDPHGDLVSLWFDWQGKRYRNQLALGEYKYLIYYDDASMAAYELIKPFIEELKESHDEVLNHFVREVAKISDEFDVKKLMYLVKHDGQLMEWSADGKAMGGYVDGKGIEWEFVEDPYNDKQYYAVNPEAYNWPSHNPALKYHNSYSSLYHPKPATEASALDIEISTKSKQLPGMGTVVDLPCKCKNIINITGMPVENTAWRVVQHLNDRHRWSREKIADWLDELHDSGKINIEFDTPEGSNE